MSKESFQVKVELGKKVSDQTGSIEGPDAWSMASRQADFWAVKYPKAVVTILRSIDGSPFVLHHIRQA